MLDYCHTWNISEDNPPTGRQELVSRSPLYHTTSEAYSPLGLAFTISAERMRRKLDCC